MRICLWDADDGGLVSFNYLTAMDRIKEQYSSLVEMYPELFLCNMWAGNKRNLFSLCCLYNCKSPSISSTQLADTRVFLFTTFNNYKAHSTCTLIH